MDIRRVLVATDLSEFSNYVVDYACEFASEVGAELILVHGVEPVYLAGPSFGPEVSHPVLKEQRKRHALKTMAELLEKLENRKVPVADHVIGIGLPDQVIVDHAKRLNADVIIVGTHGRSGFRRLMIGSVAERVVRTAECFVLTVRPPVPAEE